MSGNSHRYIPINEADEMMSQLNLARIESTKGFINNNSHGELPSDENPFNPVLSYDVQYHEPRVQQRNRVLTKYENKANETNEIALYNTRTHSLNAEDVIGLDNLQLHKEGMERARSKIHQRYESFIPQENSNPNVFNGNVYNPALPISETNQPRSTYTAAQVDERLGWFTNAREFRYESDIANNAYNLQRSPEIVERNRRQAEADDALYNRHQKSRWVEPKQAYRDRGFMPKYEHDEFTLYDASKGNDRNTGNKEKETYNLQVKAKKLNDIEHINRVKNDVEQSFQPMYHKNQIYNTMRRMNDRKDPMSNNSYTEKVEMYQEAFEPTNTKSGLFSNLMDGLLDTITDSLAVILGMKEKKRERSILMEREGFSDNSRQQRGLISNNVVYDDVFDKAREKFGYKPQHLLIMRDGNIPAVYPDEDYSNTAPMFVSRDPFDEGLVRTMVMFEDNKFKIIQKHENDKVFSGDGRPFGGDYIVSEVEIEDLPPPMRDRIRKQNMDTKRDKALELTYDDYIAFSDYMVKHIDTSDRVKEIDIWKHIRGKDFDEEVETGFDDRKVLVDSGAVQAATAEARKARLHDMLNERQYSKHEQKAPIDMNNVETMRLAPIKTASLPSSGEAFRNVQVNNTPFATKRTGGVNMRKFNQ